MSKSGVTHKTASTPPTKKEIKKVAKAIRKHPPKDATLRDLRKTIELAPAKFEKSSHVWSFARWLCAYIDQVMQSQKVGAVPLLQFLKDRHDKHGSEDTIAAMDLPTIMKTMIQCRDSLTNWKNAIPKWRYPVVFSVERTELFKRVGEYMNICKEARFHTGALQGQAADDQAAKTHSQDVWRKGRDKMRKFWTDRDVAQCIAKLCADHLQLKIQDPHGFGIKIAVSSPELPQGAMTTDSFVAPFLVRGNSAAEATCKDLPAVIGRLYDANNATAIEKMAECKTKMIRDGLTSSIGTFDLKEPFTVICGDNDQEILKSESALKCMVTAMWDNVADASLDNSPMQGHAGFYVQFTGSSMMVALPATLLETIPSVPEWLVEQPIAALQKCNVWHVLEGDAVWCPPGCMIVVLGLTPGIEWESAKKTLPDLRTKAGAVQNHILTVGQIFFHDLASIKHLNQTARLNLAANYVKASAKIPPSFKRCQGLKKWMEEAAKPVEENTD